ncbi:MAG: hypothetical protein QM533_04200 [Cytophagales bacterium]|nr:hypothetical protein [Cytophagales bacterium]
MTNTTKASLKAGDKGSFTGHVLLLTAQGSRYDGAQGTGIYSGDLPIELGIHLQLENSTQIQYLRGLGSVPKGQIGYVADWKKHLAESTQQATQAFLSYSKVTVEYLILAPGQYPLILSIR